MRTLLFCICILSAAGGEREEICGNKTKCIWLNNHLGKHYGFPLHGTLNPSSKADVYCYDGSFWTLPNPIIRFWDYLHVVVTTPTPNLLSVVHGNSSKVVLAGGKLATIHNFSSQPLLISPYEGKCVALTSSTALTYSLHAEYKLTLYLPVLFLVGCFLLFLAPTLSKSVPLLYGGGVLIGILASALILLYVISRFLPGRNFLGVGFIAGGYTLVASMFYWFLQHLEEYWDYAVAYVIIAGVISFAVLYRWGGVSDPRTLDIVRWTLQFLGLSLIYMATSLRASSIVLVTLVGVVYVVPLRFNPLFWPIYALVFVLVWVWSFLRSRTFFKPILPPWQYLSTEKYEWEGLLETAKAIEKLRNDCLSEKVHFDRLKDKQRFERFLSGEDHISMEEQVNHDWTFVEDSDLEENDEDYSEY